METILPTVLSGLLIFLGIATVGVGRTISLLKYELDFGEYSEKSTKASAWQEAHRLIGNGFLVIGLVVVVVGLISLAGGLIWVGILFGLVIVAGTTALAAAMSRGLTHVKENQKRRH